MRLTLPFLILLTATWIGLSFVSALFSLFAATTTMKPGEHFNWATRILLIASSSLPIVSLLSIIFAWTKFQAKSFRAAAGIILLPLINVAIFAAAVLMIVYAFEGKTN